MRRVRKAMGTAVRDEGGMILSEADLAQLRLEGLEHLNRLQSGAATERDEAEFLSWRRASAAHEEAFRSAVRLQRLVARTERANVAKAEAEDAGVLPFRKVPVVSRRTVLSGAIAASVAGFVIAGHSLDLIPSPDVLRADFSTGPGQRRLVRLARGASIDLNTRTAIVLRGDLDLPAVELIRGEAVLASGEGPDARVALLAGGGRSTGHAARFNARRDDTGVCITCLGGEVDVAWSGETRRLKASQEVRYDDTGMGSINTGVDTRLLTAWQSGAVIFHNMAMRDVVAEINRYRPGRVFLANADLAERQLSGTYHIARIDDFFSQAQLGLGVKVTRLPGNVVVLT